MTDENYEREPMRNERNAPVESLIRSAGGYVQPSDDLRPRTLEAAREQKGQQKAHRRISGLSVAVILLASLGLPGNSSSSRANIAGISPHIETSQDLHRHAIQRTSESKTDPNWALLEVFTEFRRKQARLFSDSL